MASQVDIYNLALGNIGSSDTVASLEERSKQRIVCSQFWDTARDTVLADFDWPFATRRETLAQMPETTSNWLYTYQYPTDCLRAQYLVVPGQRVPDEKNQARFDTGYGAGGQVLFADIEAAQLVYVCRVEDTGRFPPMFVQALSWKLAAQIAMPLTATRTIVETAMQMYDLEVQKAWAAAFNEGNQSTTYASEYITARGGDGISCGADYLIRRGF